jgi:speckle-type POZ protein
MLWCLSGSLFTSDWVVVFVHALAHTPFLFFLLLPLPPYVVVCCCSPFPRLSTVTTSKALHMLKTWTIKNWSGVARIPGQILYDREFLFANHRWRWRLYPGGVSDNVGDNVSLYLDCRDATEEHPAFERHTFRIINQFNSTNHYEQKSLPYKEHKDPDGWGWGKFISHENLDKPEKGYVREDTVRLELDLTVYDQNSDHQITDVDVDPNRKMRTVEVPPSTLADDFGELFSNEDFADITFVVGGTARFKAHKAVLTVRSPVLAGQFKSGMADSQTEEIHVDPDISPEIFREVLRFVYTDRVEENVLKTDPTHLLAAADRYGLERLKCLCESKLWDMLDGENASWVLLAADRHSATRLKHYCLDWISKNAEKILDTESFRNLTSSDPQLVVEILRVTSDPDGEAQKGIKRKRSMKLKKRIEKEAMDDEDVEDDDDFKNLMPPPPKQPPHKKQRRSSRKRRS